VGVIELRQAVSVAKGGHFGVPKVEGRTPGNAGGVQEKMRWGVSTARGPGKKLAHARAQQPGEMAEEKGKKKVQPVVDHEQTGTRLQARIIKGGSPSQPKLGKS